MSTITPPLYSVHEDNGATFTAFGGWDMPVQFDSIQAEHRAVRDTVGKFDVSHMGEIFVYGPDATELMQRMTSNDVTNLSVGQSQYSTILTEDGIIIDDTVIYRLPPDNGDTNYLFIPNAGNDDKMRERWVTHRDKWDLDVTVSNRTREYAMFAIQGPDSVPLVAAEAGKAVTELSRFEATQASVVDTECWVARTGYTGEDGFEIIAPKKRARSIWEAFDCQSCGLGARNTLRIEAGYLLAGQDFDHDGNPRNPYEAGIGFTVKLDTEFIGRDALTVIANEGPEDTFVGFRLTDRGIPRHGYPITDETGTTIGAVTSGTMSPTLNEPIGLGYVPIDYADEGTAIGIEIRGQQKNANIESVPFIDTI